MSNEVPRREYVGKVELMSGGFGVGCRSPLTVSYAEPIKRRGLVRKRGSAWNVRALCAASLPCSCEPEHAAIALESALQVIANRWKPSIVLYFAAGPQRRRDLEQRLPRYVSAKVLTEPRRALEAEGLVYRVDRTPAGHGRHVTYALTELGETLGPILITLAGWAVEHRPDLLKGRVTRFRTRDHER